MTANMKFDLALPPARFPASAWTAWHSAERRDMRDMRDMQQIVNIVILAGAGSLCSEGGSFHFGSDLPSISILRTVPGMKREMVRTRQRICRALGLITLSVVSAFASAESAEFRRGYDQGYRDGLEAQGRQQHQQHHGRARAPIQIEEARYGVRGASCDASDQVQQAVGWRRHVSIAVNNNLCGDPAPGVQKRLRVTYRCDNGEAFEVRGPERGVATLYCR